MLTTLRRRSTALIALLALALGGLVLIPAGGSAADPVAPLWDLGMAQEVPGKGTLAFDVAEDMTRFVFAEQPVHEDGMPAYGNPFITQGYIYPAGTLERRQRRQPRRLARVPRQGARRVDLPRLVRRRRRARQVRPDGHHDPALQLRRGIRRDDSWSARGTSSPTSASRSSAPSPAAPASTSGRAARRTRPSSASTRPKVSTSTFEIDLIAE